MSRQKQSPLMRRCSRSLSCLCTNQKPNWMRRTSRSWTWFRHRLHSRSSSSRLTRTSRLWRKRNSREQHAASRRFWLRQRTAKLTWRGTMTHNARSYWDSSWRPMKESMQWHRNTWIIWSTTNRYIFKWIIICSNTTMVPSPLILTSHLASVKATRCTITINECE